MTAQHALAFRGRVAIFADSGAMLFMAGEADCLIFLAGGAAVLSKRVGRVSAIKLAKDQSLTAEQQRLWPGSYGIKREHSPQGVYFQHRKTWEPELKKGATNSKSVTPRSEAVPRP